MNNSQFLLNSLSNKSKAIKPGERDLLKTWLEKERMLLTFYHIIQTFYDFKRRGF